MITSVNSHLGAFPWFSVTSSVYNRISITIEVSCAASILSSHYHLHHKLASTGGISYLTRSTLLYRRLGRKLTTPSTIHPRASRLHCTMAKLIYPDPLVIPARMQHTATVIVLHGLGDTSRGWSFVAEKDVWGGSLPHAKFIIPTAPTRAVTRNMGMEMPAWFDIDSRRGEDRREDEQGVNASFTYVTELVEKEIANGITPDRMAIAGFSQGGAVALTMLRSPHKFAGIIGMSCYLPQLKDTAIASNVNKSTPVLLCHGIYDEMVKFEYGHRSHKMLQQAVESVEFKEYQMGHSASREELADTRVFLESVLSAV